MARKELDNRAEGSRLEESTKLDCVVRCTLTHPWLVCGGHGAWSKYQKGAIPEVRPPQGALNLSPLGVSAIGIGHTTA